MYKVYETMTIKPVSVSEEETVMTAARIMNENKVASLVIKKGDELAGLLTEKNIVRRLVAANFDANNTKISEVMSRDVLTIHSTAELIDAVTRMNKSNQRQLPVVDNGKLVGLLTMKDILRVQPHLFGLMYENMKVKEESRKPLYESSEAEGICDSCGNYTFNLNDSDDQSICSDCKEML